MIYSAIFIGHHKFLIVVKFSSQQQLHKTLAFYVLVILKNWLMMSRLRITFLNDRQSETSSSEYMAMFGHGEFTSLQTNTMLLDFSLLGFINSGG